MPDAQDKLAELVTKVEKMRHWQVTYFRSAKGGRGSQAALGNAKRAEEQVDRFLQDYRQGQQNLF